MGRFYGSSALVAVCAVLAALLAGLAGVQYQWSTRVAAADVQREREHLDSAAALFATEFNAEVGRAVEFLQNSGAPALASGEPLSAPPKLIGELYYLVVPSKGPAKARRLTTSGTFADSAVPGWMPEPRCVGLVEQPPALVIPIPEAVRAERFEAAGLRILRTFSGRPGRCFVVRIDQQYLRDALFPELIRRSFGETSAGEYDFAIVSRRHPGKAIYGAPLRPDLRKPFFSPAQLLFRRPPAPPQPGQDRTATVYVERMESTVVTNTPGPPPEPLGASMWELQVAHKGVPLAAAFDQQRRRDLLLSMAVETLLAAAIVFLVVGARRIQRLADQKLRFIAGVSHELRTPVSAITMLSRNQADGLVAGPDKVKQYGELIHQESRRLNEMVERTLAYAGAHSQLPRAARQEVAVRDLVEETVGARREEFARRGFDIEIDVGPEVPPVPGDPKLLRTALDNLLSNAEKHACGGRWIRVSAAYEAREKEVRISVEDRGGGIDPAEQADIFEPFCRGRAAIEAQTPGSGLGLSLVRSAAEAHRGSVTLVSEPGRGSTFTLHLPV